MQGHAVLDLGPQSLHLPIERALHRSFVDLAPIIRADDLGREQRLAIDPPRLGRDRVATRAKRKPYVKMFAVIHPARAIVRIFDEFRRNPQPDALLIEPLAYGFEILRFVRIVRGRRERLGIEQLGEIEAHRVVERMDGDIFAHHPVDFPLRLGIGVDELAGILGALAVDLVGPLLHIRVYHRGVEIALQLVDLGACELHEDSREAGNDQKRAHRHRAQFNRLFPIVAHGAHLLVGREDRTSRALAHAFEIYACNRAVSKLRVFEANSALTVLHGTAYRANSSLIFALRAVGDPDINGYMRDGHSNQSLRRAADAILDHNTVLFGQYTRRIVRGNADAREQRPIGGCQQAGELLQAGLVLNLDHALDTAAARHLEQVDAAAGVARLHAGLAVKAVVEHHDGQILRLLHANGGEAAKSHQHFAIASDDGDACLRLRQRQAKPDHRGATHRAPEVEVAVVVACSEGIPGA